MPPTSIKPFAGPDGWVPVHNSVFDVLLPRLSNPSLRILLAIIRATIGWQKQADQLSYTTLQRRTGLTRPSIASGLAQLLNAGMIMRDPCPDTRGSFLYRLNLDYEIEIDGGGADHQEENRTGTSKEIEPVLVKKLNTQHKATDSDIHPSGADDKTFVQILNETAGILVVNPIQAEEIIAWEEDVPASWMVDACQIAADQNKRSWAYVRGILKRWRTEGRNDNKPQTDSSLPDRDGYASQYQGWLQGNPAPD